MKKISLPTVTNTEDTRPDKEYYTSLNFWIFIGFADGNLTGVMTAVFAYPVNIVITET